MSLSPSNVDPRRVCRINLPSLPPFLRNYKRSFWIYLAGASFAVGWWLFFDACILSTVAMRKARPPPGGDDGTPLPELPPVHISFADWVPGLLATLGMIVINLIDKSHLVEDDFNGPSLGGGSDPVAWRARLWLFVGFALLAGGLSGSATLLVVKYLIHASRAGFEYYGLANVAQSFGIMLATIILWSTQSVTTDYEYSLNI